MKGKRYHHKYFDHVKIFISKISKSKMKKSTIITVAIFFDATFSSLEHNKSSVMILFLVVVVCIFCICCGDRWMECVGVFDCLCSFVYPQRLARLLACLFVCLCVSLLSCLLVCLSSLLKLFTIRQHASDIEQLFLSCL